MKEIGLVKALLFVLYGLYMKLLSWAILPPLRTVLMRMIGATIGKAAVIFDVRLANLYHHGLHKLTIGQRCFIGDGAMIDVRGGIVLEDDVTVSNLVTIVTHINVGYEDHPLQMNYPTKEQKVHIKRGAYLGTSCVILPGVTVGRGSVVGAGAVVTHDVPDHTLVVGVPARVKKKLNP